MEVHNLASVWSQRGQSHTVLGGTLGWVRGSSHNLHHGKFQFDITKKLSIPGYSGTGVQDLVASPCEEARWPSSFETSPECLFICI